MAYSRETVLPHHEAADFGILSHIIAIAPEFDLKVFQYPGGKRVEGVHEGISTSFPSTGIVSVTGEAKSEDDLAQAGFSHRVR